MTQPSVSVIVVSRGRPDYLKSCLLGISQLYYDPFEVVVVADRQGLDAVENSKLAQMVKTAHFDQANISVARNIGLTLAAGEIVAFIDDDAVPEPGWLFQLAAQFWDKTVDAAGGYVRSRNGISFQHKAKTINQYAVSETLAMKDQQPRTFVGRPGWAITTIGTNCAFRRSVFEEIGGFDPAFHYFLDESDINMRLAQTKKRTAIVPLAEVHHSVAASDQRNRDRMPRSLFENGASLVVFLRKHAGDADHSAHIENAMQANRKQMLKHMVRGDCEPRDVARLLSTFQAGVANGYDRVVGDEPQIAGPSAEFMGMPFQIDGRAYRIVSGYRASAKELFRQASKSVISGEAVSLFLFSRTSLFHKVKFDPRGFWVQTGGLFGKSDRTERLFQLTNLAKRVAKEDKRVAAQRHPWRASIAAID